jgi:malonyl-CoA decarboxylase
MYAQISSSVFCASTLTLEFFSKLFTQIIAQPNGMKVLVDMRRDLLSAMRAVKDDAKLKALEDNLRSLLQHWFSVGFLDLQRITWSSPALLLEKIKEYSASVHPVKTWDDLKLRLGRAKRCYGFFHPSMPLEPLVFIEVALVKGVSDKIAVRFPGHHHARL